MEKKGLVKKENVSLSNTAGLSARAFAVVKFVLGLCLLPFVYSSVAFLNEFSAVEKPVRNSFWGGVVSLLVLFLFIWEPAIIYVKGQRLLEAIFCFFKPLVKVAPFLLPVYTIILFIAYGLSFAIFKSAAPLKHIVFLAGFTMALHLIFGARSIRSKQGDFLKANYIFGFALIYIINISLLAFCLSLVFREFSFVNFADRSYQIAGGVFYAVFRQLFL
jgi:hypothetical protein